MGQIRLDPNYVLHQLTLEEFSVIYDGWFENYQNNMEQTRLICYNIFNASPNRTKSFTIQDFMPFAWDGRSGQPSKVIPLDRFLSLKSFLDQIN